jgi:hypothetical protein
MNGDVLVVLSGRDESENRQRQRLIATWNRLHPEKSARIEEFAGGRR